MSPIAPQALYGIAFLLLCLSAGLTINLRPSLSRWAFLMAIVAGWVGVSFFRFDFGLLSSGLLTVVSGAAVLATAVAATRFFHRPDSLR